MSTDPLDFPAAHSADTDWFAVDADGFVALVASGEPGAVPADIGAQETFSEELRTVAEAEGELGAPVDRRVVLDPVAFDVPTLDDTSVFHPPADDQPYIVFLDALDAVQADVDAGRAQPLAASVFTAVRYEKLPRETWERLWREGRCLGCLSDFLVDRWSSDPPAPDATQAAPALGLYYFDCDDYDGATYQRRLLPATPRRFDQLPPKVRALVVQQGVQLPVRFSELSKLQPADWIESAVWGEQARSLRDAQLHDIDGVAQIVPSFRPSAEHEPTTWLAADRMGRLAVFFSPPGCLRPVGWHGHTDTNPLESVGSRSEKGLLDAHALAAFPKVEPDSEELDDGRTVLVLGPREQHGRSDDLAALSEVVYLGVDRGGACTVELNERVRRRLKGAPLAPMLDSDERADFVPGGLELLDAQPLPQRDLHLLPQKLELWEAERWLQAGFYVYAGLGNAGEPFQRVGVPETPLLYPLLTEAQRATLAAAVLLPTRFAHALQLQPADLIPSEGHIDYRALDGTTYPIGQQGWQQRGAAPERQWLQEEAEKQGIPAPKQKTTPRATPGRRLVLPFTLFLVLLGLVVALALKCGQHH